MTQVEVPDLALSCWIIEAARSSVLAERGHGASGARAAQRARILARACAAEGVKIQPRIAGEHSEWMRQIAGSDEELGALGRVFLQRLGMYVDAHMKRHLPEGDHRQLLELSERDLVELNEALSVQGLPALPDDDWPPPRVESAETTAPGQPGQGSPPTVRLGILGDPHIEPHDNAYVEEAVGGLDAADVAFTIVPGDLTRDGEEESFAAAADLLGRASRPVFCSLGNHDMAALPAGGGTAPGPERFEKRFGTRPYGVYEADGVRIILLNSAVPALSPFPPFDMLGGDFTDEPTRSVPWGDFSDEVSEWMSTLGVAEGPTFVFLHHPPYPYPGFPPLVFGLGSEATRKLASLVEETSAQAVFCGHTHRSARRILSGVPLIEVPSIRHWPFVFALLEIGRNASGKGGWWSYGLRAVGNPPGKAKDHAAYIFHRYAAGDKTAHEIHGTF